MPSKERLLVQSDHRHKWRARFAVAPDLVDEGAAMGVDGLEALRADETSRGRLKQLITFAEHLQLARRIPPRCSMGEQYQPSCKHPQQLLPEP